MRTLFLQSIIYGIKIIVITGAMLTTSFTASTGGLIFANNIGCRGTEARLIDCPRSGAAGCTHAMDVGVTCQGGMCGVCIGLNTLFHSSHSLLAPPTSHVAPPTSHVAPPTNKPFFWQVSYSSIKRCWK